MTFAFKPCGLAAALLIAGSALAPSQAVEPRAPQGPIEMVIGTSVGGTPDVFFRRVAKLLNEEGIISNPIVPVNRAGGSWMIAANYVLRRPGDENIMFLVAAPLLATPIVQGLAPPHEKLTPIAMFIYNDVVLMANPAVPGDTLKDVVEDAKKAGKRLKYGGAQAASTDRIVAGQVNKATGLNLNYVPFDGGGAALTAFLAGDVDLTATSVDEAFELARAKKAKLLAVLTDARRTEPRLKDIPTAKEQGYDIVWSQEMGLIGPPNLDPAVVAWWDLKLRKLMATKAWDDLSKEMYWREHYVGADKARADVDRMYQDHLKVLRDIGMSKK